MNITQILNAHCKEWLKTSKYVYKSAILESKTSFKTTDDVCKKLSYLINSLN